MSTVLICVNSGVIRKSYGNLFTGYGVTSWGDGLVEGREYETDGEAYLNEDGEKCYYIKGLGPRFASRFTKKL